MADTNFSQEGNSDRVHEPPLSSEGVSRRSFLKVSALGAGAVALPGLSCAATAATTPPESSGGCSAPATDHWVEPPEWIVGRHGDTPLRLQVEEVDAPAWLRSLGNCQGPKTLFTYNGTIPGPTIRMGGNDVLRVELVNNLSGNDGKWAHKNSARFAKYAKVRGYSDDDHPDGVFQANENVPDITDWELSRTLIYGPHQQHTTNLHTHGLHVAPARNPDGTHSDNVLLRVIPTQDFENRMNHEPPLPLDPVHEVVGNADYEFRLGATSRTPTHPPGTHWYHPHPHGATYDQVATGMAGFLLVEGDVDEKLNAEMADMPAYNYRERLILLQRIFDTGTAPLEEGEGAGSNIRKKEADDGTSSGTAHVQTVNGQLAGTLAFSMEAGAIERWRVLNGSVDGQGYIRFVVANADAPPMPKAPDPGDPATNDAYNRQLTEWATTNGLDMWNMAFDGVTLVTRGGKYTARKVNALQMAPANRADFLFQAPQTEGAYIIWGIADNHRAGDAANDPTKIATLTVTARQGAPSPVDDTFFPNLLGEVPVPDYLKPISDDEVTGVNPRGEARGFRTRQVIYSGWGDQGYQCAPSTASKKGKNSMVISRMKFDPDRPVQLMALDTAEEWVLDNYSVGKPYYPAGAVDHPFHMHQNPFWVMAILEPSWPSDTPDPSATPTYTNVLDAPRWQDVVPIPNSGGRVIFRSRFPDYTGFYVNHCHILQHEDWGMMQAVEIVWDPIDANNDWDKKPYNVGNPNDTSGSYPKPTMQNLVDYCTQVQNLDGEIVNGKILDGTPVKFC